jgi:hypothetical protein
MATDRAYQLATKAIEQAKRSSSTALDLSGLNLARPDVKKAPRLKLSTLPDSIGELPWLRSLDISYNNLTTLPVSLARLTQLETLHVQHNILTSLPESIGQLENLRKLDIYGNRLRELPSSIGRLKHLTILYADNPFGELPEVIRELSALRDLGVADCGFSFLPEWVGELSDLEWLNLPQNKLTDLPSSIAGLKKLRRLDLRGNPLSPELAAANEEGVSAVQRYLLARAGAQIELNEAKLILIGEGEVGKSSLLAALRDEPWEEGKPTTHGIEIKRVKVANPKGGNSITLNGWDFGGQRVYRPTHQLFFSSPAVYLVVWKPREGSQQGFVKEWISLVKHRAPEAKILVVATHGGPKQRQPDIDRQEIWDLFGRDMVVDFFFVDSKPAKNTKKRRGISDLKRAIANAAAGLPEMGRSVPARWEETRYALTKTGDAYLSLEALCKLCKKYGVDGAEANDFIRISNRLGHLIHYEHDPLLQDIVVLKPDWLSTAISFVLDDEQTRAAHGLVSDARLGQLWNDPKRQTNRYPIKLHPIFVRLMERYDLSYKISDARLDHGKINLIAQLVPDVRPSEKNLTAVWPSAPIQAGEQQTQICRIVDAKSGQSATAEGLFFQLIVRLHKYSLGCENYAKSVHWQRGLVLDYDYNGRAILEHVGNDVRITVRAAYPERFLSVLTNEVKWLVESFWKGLRCEVTVPCMAPCGMGIPGTGLFEVEKLIAFKKQSMSLFPCFVSGCNQAQDIDGLLRNAPTVRRTPIDVLLADEFGQLRTSLDRIRVQLAKHGREMHNRFQTLDQNDRRIMSQVEDAYNGLMQALTDEAREGPRLFSFEPVDRRIFELPRWISIRFRLILWCEHSRLPLPAINGLDSKEGIYELDIPREWLVRATPYIRLVTRLLSLVVPVAASAIKLELGEATYKGIESQLNFGEKSLEETLKGGEEAEEWILDRQDPDLQPADAIRAKGAVLRQLHAWIKEQDPGFGGLVRVQNRRQEFLWVHPRFASEY